MSTVIIYSLIWTIVFKSGQPLKSFKGYGLLEQGAGAQWLCTWLVNRKL